MAEIERREPRFEGESRLWAARLGGLGPGDRPVASGATRRHRAPLGWLLLVAVIAGIGWLVWRYTDLGQQALSFFEPVAAPTRISVDLILETERVLDRLGLQPGRIDGKLDPVTIDSIRTYQKSAGLPVTGEPSRALLQDMRAVAADMNGN